MTKAGKQRNLEVFHSRMDVELNWPEAFAVDDDWQDFCSKTLLVDTEQVLEEKIHLVMSEHLIVQTEETLDYTMMQTKKEQRSSALASND